MNPFCVTLDEPECWTNILREIQHSAFHTWEYCSALCRSSGKEIVLYVSQCPEGKLVCPVSFREMEPGFPEIFTPYGFGGIITSGENQRSLADQWFQYWKSEGCVTAYILQHPCFRLSSEAWGRDLHDYNEYFVLDLECATETIWQNLCKTHRYEIRRFHERGVGTIVCGGQDVRSALCVLYPHTMQRVGATSVYSFSRECLEYLADSDHALLLGMEVDRSIVAVALFLVCGSMSEYFISASSPEGRRYARILIWDAIVRLRQRGVRVLNLGGGVRIGDSLADFKRRFGARPEKGQVIKQIFSSDDYRHLAEKYSSCFDPTTTWFPPYWSAKSS